MRDSMILYTIYADKFKKLSDLQFGQLIRLMMQYQTDGEVPEIEDIAVALAFDVAKVDLDTNNEKYDQTCEKRREAGAKGGQANANKNKQKVANDSIGEQKVANGSKAKQKVANASDDKQKVAKLSKDKQREANSSYNDNDNEYEYKEKVLSNDNTKKKGSQARYVDDDRLNSAVMDFIEHRKKLRKPMTDKAVELFLARVEKFCPFSIDGQIELINTAIGRGWQTVYPDDEKATSVEPKPPNKDKLRMLENMYLEEV